MEAEHDEESAERRATADETDTPDPWEKVRSKFEAMRVNPPGPPMSQIDIDEHYFVASVGPIRPGTVNWGVYLFLVCAVVVPPLIWFQDWWFVGPPAALLLTYLFRKNLSPMTERLEISEDSIVVERSWDIPLLGKTSDTTRIWTNRAKTPHVYRLAEKLEAYEEGRGPRPGIGYEGLVFESLDGEKATYGISIMNKNKVIDEASYDDKGELDWIEEMAIEYLEYVRDETDESSDDEAGAE